VAPASVTRSRTTHRSGEARIARDPESPPPPDIRAQDDVVTADDVALDARAAIEHVAGTVMIGFGIIFLVVLSDLALGALIAGGASTKARIMRLLIPGAVFCGGALLGAWLTRSTECSDRAQAARARRPARRS
jgi:hypothetical protein